MERIHIQKVQITKSQQEEEEQQQQKPHKKENLTGTLTASNFKFFTL